MRRLVLLAFVVFAPAALADPPPDGAAIYRANCAECHGGRVPLGGMAPRSEAFHSGIMGPRARDERAVLDEYLADLRAARRAPGQDLSILRGPGVETLAGGARPPLPPRWALEPWKWKNEHSGPKDVMDDVEAMEKHGVPCGVYLIDSPWANGYGTFEFFAPRWRQEGEEVAGEKLVRDLQARGLEVVLWATCVVNDGTDTSPPWDLEAERALFADGLRRGAFYDHPLWRATLGRGLAAPRIKWWKGVGAHIDVSRDAGRAWYYELLDRALVGLGVDGFKVDGGWPPLTDDYYFQTSAHVARRTHGRGVTLSRPRGGNLSSASACWTGDEEPTFAGLRHALRRMRLAADDGYGTVGSDIGGFGGPPSEEVLVRWAQVGLFSGVMELGGGGVHEPWLISPSCVERYRRLATWRLELVPYLHHAAHVAHLGGPTLLRFGPGEHDFTCGDALFLAPITTADGGRRVRLPSGGRWIEWHEPSRAHDGGREVAVPAPTLDAFPLFVREGAIVPLEVASDLVGNGRAQSAGALTLDVWPGEQGESALDYLWGDAPGPEPTRITMRAEGGATTIAFAGRALPYGDLVLKVNRRGHATGTVLPRQSNERFPMDRTAPGTIASVDEAAFWTPSRETLPRPRLWVDEAREITWVRLSARGLREVVLR
jgi:hypothetical protein